MTTAAELNARIADVAEGNWIHRFEIDEERRISCPESFAYRRRILESVFGSLLLDRSVLVLQEASGIYPALLHRSGAARVTATSTSEGSRRLMRDVWEFLDVPATALASRMLAFYDDEPYVDAGAGGAHEFLVVLNQIWGMFSASGQSFDAIAEACAFLVSDGVVFDWTDAEWAKPAPPEHYRREAFAAALRKKFEHVACYSDWLVVATGKLEPAAGGPATSGQVSPG